MFVSIEGPMSTSTLVAIASLVYAVFAVSIGQAAKSMNVYLSTAIFNTLGGLTPFVAYLVLPSARAGGLSASTLPGYIYSVLAGLAIAGFNILLLTVSSRGGVAYAIPAVYGGAVVLSALAGWLLLGEPFSGLHGAGVAVVAVGVAMVVVSKL